MPDHPEADYPVERAELVGEAEAGWQRIERALAGVRVLDEKRLYERAGAAHWTRGSFHAAVERALAEGRIHRVGENFYGLGASRRRRRRRMLQKTERPEHRTPPPSSGDPPTVYGLDSPLDVARGGTRRRR